MRDYPLIIGVKKIKIELMRDYIIANSLDQQFEVPSSAITLTPLQIKCLDLPFKLELVQVGSAIFDRLFESALFATLRTLLQSAPRVIFSGRGSR